MGIYTLMQKGKVVWWRGQPRTVMEEWMDGWVGRFDLDDLDHWVGLRSGSWVGG